MRFALRFLAMAIGFWSALAGAKVTSFPADNFSLDAPAAWAPDQFPTMPPQIHVPISGRNPSNHNSYEVMITKAPGHIVPEAFLKGMKQAIEKAGLKPSETRDTTINGKPFAVVTVSREANQPPFRLLATTFTKDSVYALQIVAPAGNVENAPDLSSILQSFRFLQPVESVSRHDAVPHSDFEISETLGKFAGAMIVGAILLRLFFRSAKRNS